MKKRFTIVKKRFTIGGAIAGLLYGIAVMVNAFTKVPGHPGIFELIVQATIVGGLPFSRCIARPIARMDSQPARSEEMKNP